MNDNRVNILIIGGGFAGVECARRLATEKGLRVALITADDHMEYYPAAFRVFESRDPDLARIAFKQILPPTTRLIIDRVSSVDVTNNTVSCSSGAIYYADYLVLAMGSQSAFYNIPGVSENAFPFRGSRDVLNIRRHIDDLITKCTDSDPEEQLVAFRFVVVGGGPAGCEIASNVAHYAHRRSRECGIPHDVVSVVLLEGRERILSMFSPEFSEAVSHKLHSLGVQIMPYRRLMENKPWSAIMQDVQMGTRTVIWTAGVEPATVVRSINVPKSPKGRIIVDKQLAITGHTTIYAVGDIAETVQTGLAQTAIYDGEFVARDIIARIHNSERPEYTAPQVSHIVPLNRWSGVVSFRGFVLSGWIGWIARAFADAMYLVPRIGIKNTFARMLKSL